MADDVKAALATTVPETADDLAVKTGGQVGRFTLESVLGAGGMGIVFVSRDPVLDRRIAVKVIRGSSSRAESRLLREAQGLARLAHPNVVTVYEAGVTNGSVFIAMELVEGTNLREWLEKPRTWRAIVSTFLAAGRGLAAAHEAGLVHRDFKPANVFVDHGGAVKVGDFGLVGIVGEDEAAEPGAALALHASMTKTGNVMGTPEYMAPEQVRGEIVDERADQYAFCVALKQAVAKHGVPAWLEQALERGLSKDAAERWPSMQAMLDAIERAPRRRRNLAISAGAALVVAGAVTVGAVVAGGKASVSCEIAGEPAGAVWNAAARDSIVTAFGATKLAWAPDAATRVVTGIDRWVERWRDVRVQACRATHERGDQSPALLDKRVACLDRQLATLAALTGALAHPDAHAIQSASTAVASLANPETCTAERVAGTAPIAPQAADAERAIAAAETAFRLRAPDVMARADAALAAAQQSGEPAARARALAIHGSAIAPTDPVRARRELDAAQTAAAAARDPGLEAEVVFAAIVVAAEKDTADRLETLMPVARAAVERAGSPPPLTRDLARSEFFASMRSGRIDDARAACTKMTELALPDDRTRVGAACECRLALVVRDTKAVPRCEADYAAASAHFGKIHPDTEKPLHNLVIALAFAGRIDDSAARIDELHALVAQLYGERSHDMAAHLKLAASIENARGKTANARKLLETAVAILDEVAPDSSDRGGILMDLSRRARELGDIAGGIRFAERGLAATEKRLGSENVELASVWAIYAGAIGEDPAQRTRAIAAWDRAVAIAEKAPSGGAQVLAAVLDEYSSTLVGWSLFKAALPLARRAANMHDSLGNERPAALSRRLVGVCLSELKQEPAEARAVLVAARAVLVKSESNAEVVADIDKRLAKLPK